MPARMKDEGCNRRRAWFIFLIYPSDFILLFQASPRFFKTATVECALLSV